MSVRNLSPEAAVLLRQVFRSQGTALPWPDGLTAELFFKETATQGMALLLLRSLMQRPQLSWPAELLVTLKAAALRHAAAELRLEADLRALLHALAAADIQPLVLKGTALAYSLYPEPWLRPRCDTDLLVREAERSKAAAVLQHLGYKPLLETNAEYLGTQTSYSKTVRGVHYSYDLHWQISNSSRQFSRSFIANGLQSIAIPAIDGGQARTLCPTDALLYACFHRAGHFAYSGDRLIWLYDIHLLAQSLNEADAAAFCAKAKKLAIAAVCADAIAVAKDWFDTQLSAPLATLLRTRPNDEAFAILLQGSSRQDGIKLRALLTLKDLSSWRQRLRFLLQKALPPPEFMLWRYKAKSKYALPCLYLRRLAEAVWIFLKR